jgi:hypothetical protein
VITYSLGPGDSELIQVPVDQAVFIIGTNTTRDDHGTGFISLEASLNDPGNGPFLEWSGLNSTSGGAPTLTGGFSGTEGTTMVKIDFAGQVTLQVGTLNPAVGFAGFFIKNASGVTQTGSVWILSNPPPP